MVTQSNKSIAKAFRLIEIVCSESGPISLRHIASKANLSLPTTHRLLGTLKAVGALQATGDGTFKLGEKLVGIHASISDNIHQVRKIVELQLKDLLSKAGISARLSMLDDGELVIMAGNDSGVHQKMRSTIGYRYEAYCTAPGKLLLAALSIDQLNAYLNEAPLVRITHNTICEPRRLLDEIAHIRTVEYALDDQEFIEGVRCIAVPLKDKSERTVAALSIAGEQLGLRDLSALIPQLRQKASLLSAQLRELPRGMSTLLDIENLEVA
ncbi:IclR family transcriptional regulator [Bosea psychrotolerans]|uniref:IclR family transcriptional regulator n=1 Tax=Bosea psychrotolerans TaxID=1871628 RepID=A0A2S4MB29_9HYPH|nr:IclR family transcriptional regulator [Bosea psychrotolerans]POR51942.1 IclR family transcriptional regulator [Bosea psychrotolerans]